MEKYRDQYNSQRLGKYRLPVIQSINHLLELLDISDRERFFFYSNNRKRLYTVFQIQKKSGGYRTIEAPNNQLKNIQKAIDSVFFKHFELSDSCCAYRTHFSIVDNALPHRGAKTLFKFDISDFFPSITLKDVYYLFRYYGYGKNVAKYLGFLCVNGDCVLPQGAPTSPMISNLVCVRLDARIVGYCKSTENTYGLKYTRYADDITISTQKRLDKNDINKIKAMIYFIIQNEGFTPNYRKTKVFHSGQKMAVTSVVVNNYDKVSIDKKRIREMEIAIHCIRKYGLSSHLEYLEKNKNIKWDKTSYEKHIFGLAFYMKMIDLRRGEQYIKSLKELFSNE